MKRIMLVMATLLITACSALQDKPATFYATGDLGIIIERETGSVAIFNSTEQRIISTVTGLGDLSHASAVFSRDERFAYVFGRDGGLTKIDILRGKIDKRIMQSGNSIGGAISQDGKLIAVSNYTPGGVRVFNANTLQLVADIPVAQHIPLTIAGEVREIGNPYFIAIKQTEHKTVAGSVYQSDSF